MSSNNLIAELLEKMRTLMHAVVLFGWTLLSDAVRLGACAPSGRGVRGTLFTLAVLTMLCAGDPIPTPTPTPIPI